MAFVKIVVNLSTITYQIGFGGASNSNSPIVLVESPYRYKIN